MKYFTFFLTAALLSFAVSSAVYALSPKTNPDCWGRCAPTPAVVNPAVLSPSQKVVSLRGAWDFKTDPGFGSLLQFGFGNLNEDFWSDKLSINVPGCWEAQGVGEPGLSQTWDCKWDCNPRPLNHVYTGGAIYRKLVRIPENWQGSRIWLKVGGVRSEARFWIDGVPIGIINNYCGSYKYDVTPFAKPGKTVELIGYVRNDVPSRKGQMCDFHKFGGLYRDVEFEATPQTWLDDVWVQGQLSKTASERQNARVHLTVKTVREREDVDLYVAIKTPDGNIVAENRRTLSVAKNIDDDHAAETVVDIPVDGVKLWSPESPILYLADVKIVNRADKTEHGWVERFGFRKFEVIGNRFYFNNLPFFIRGYGETFIYPETLVSPADRKFHLKNFEVIKEAGFNETRMHTHCELPEYFEAADEAGVLIQPELPYYSSVPTEGFEPDPMRDLQELYRHYRRYTSFAIYCMGNEGEFDPATNAALFRWVKENDPDRVYQLQDGGRNTPEVSDFCTQPYNVWPRGTYDGLPYPFVAHEYLNLTVKLDPRLEPLFTGAIPSPVSMEEYEARLKKFGLTREWGDACIHAAGALQAFWQKEGIESARRDPACDGYCFWNFIDQMVVQGPAYTSQGYMNAFYQVKDGGITPKEFARFNSPVALLPEFDSTADIYTAGDVVPLSFWIANYGDRPLKQGKIEWRLEDVTNANETVAEGAIPFEEYAVGETRIAAIVGVSIPELQHAAELKLHAEIYGASVENTTTIWTFPKRQPLSLGNCLVDSEFAEWFAERFEDVVEYTDETKTDGDKILITPYGSESYHEGIQDGRRILAIRQGLGASNVSLGWWAFGSQLGTAFATSHAFDGFPVGKDMIPSLWFRMMTDDPLTLSESSDKFNPLALGELVDGYSLYVGEKKEGNARILATFGLNLLQDVAESQALLDSFIKYVESDGFNPQYAAADN